MGSEQRVLDAIDALVDEQMRQERSGYDHNINQQRCPHCGDDRHTLAITERMREMRSKFRSTISYYEDDPQVSQDLVDELNSYRYDQDDSRIVCPGSDFIGPIPAASIWTIPEDPFLSYREYWVVESADQEFRALGFSPEGHLPPTPNESRVRLWDADWNCVYDSATDTRNYWEVIRERGDERTNYSIDRRNGVRESGRVEAGPHGHYFARDDQYLRAIQTWMNPFILMANADAADRLRRASEQLQTTIDLVRDTLGVAIRAASEEASATFSEFRHGWLSEPTEPVEPTPQQRALPRPSETPPMWAINPTRQRRNRRRP